MLRYREGSAARAKVQSFSQDPGRRCEWRRAIRQTAASANRPAADKKIQVRQRCPTALRRADSATAPLGQREARATIPLADADEHRLRPPLLETAVAPS